MLLFIYKVVANVRFKNMRHIHSDTSFQSLRGHFFFVKSLTWGNKLFDFYGGREFTIFKRRPEFGSWARKIPWRREWLPTPEFLLGEFWDFWQAEVYGISQARILEWFAIPFSRRSSQPRDQTHISCITGGFYTTEPPGKPIARHILSNLPSSVPLYFS